MIFDVLKKRWLRKEFLKLENSLRERRPHWPKTLVVVFDAAQTSDIEIFKKWANTLHIPKENLTLLGFTKDTKKDSVEGAVLFDKNLVKWTGGISSEDFKNVLGKSYDLQINYFETPSVMTRYVSLKLDSGFKVGYPSHEECSYDLAVNVPLTNQELFISEIAKYLKILNN
ncbi:MULTISPECIES: hypothetical protein [Nonlabens]|uniref:DUF6913 domain-containing protein n=1 Tax=Nonlabens TaxID=363408 RepID=UPI0032641638